MTANPQGIGRYATRRTLRRSRVVKGRRIAICCIKINWLGIKLKLKEPRAAQVEGGPWRGWRKMGKVLDANCLVLWLWLAEMYIYMGFCGIANRSEANEK